MEKKTIYVLCNPGHVQFKKPLRWSRLVDRFGNLVVAAEYDYNEYKTITEEDAERLEFWSREIGASNCFEEEDYKPRVMRKKGIFQWIIDQYNASTESNVAAIVGDIARYEEKDPIELFNSL